MKGLMEGPILKSNDPKALYKLAADMNSCFVALSECGYMSDLNNHEVVDKIFLRLPYSLQREFHRRSQSFYAHGKALQFEDLMKFEQKSAALSSTRFGNLLASSGKLTSSSSPQSLKHSNRRVNTFSMQTPSIGGQEARQASLRCLECRQDHHIWSCVAFKRKSRTDKRRMAVSQDLCWNCLNSGHIV